MRLVDHQPGAMAPRRRDKGRQIGNVAIHAVMPFDHEQRIAVARPRLGEQPVGLFVVEMAERHASRSRQQRSLNNAVVDQGIMDDEVVAPEQTADDGHIGRVAADEDNAVLGAVQLRQSLFEFAVKRALAGNRAACRDRGAIAVDGALGGVGDLRVAVEAEVVVRCEINIAPVADDGFGPGDALVHAKEWISDPEELGGLADHANLAISVEPRRVEPRADEAAGAFFAVIRRPRRRRRGQPFEQARLGLRRQSEQVASRFHAANPPRPS